ncbi:MAG: arylesterase [Burkholderiales bacterium RIFOXYC12_FULL_65_23]|uniref:arylesterase n=1 Tax=Malikia spinosa TaxID=86180 RepID=UPI0008D29105|nr:arylesterase [Malikia spinosa]OGB70865.1 MAG: arylesterase [Burkholderiales bacterium RIFOXYC12_FULL_65_23]
MDKIPQLTRRYFNSGLGRALLAGACVPGLLGTAAAAEPRRLLIVGDSLSAEYGLQRGTGWAALLQQRLDARQPGWQVVNASISGDTTAGGQSRLAALLQQHRPAVVVIELGGNDALRGLPLEMTRDNLRAMTRAARQAGARVLLLGMQVPPNYGARHAEQFRQLYAEVAKAEQAALLPFFLAGVADGANPTALFQADRIHPNEAAQPRMLENVWGELRRLLKP